MVRTKPIAEEVVAEGSSRLHDRELRSRSSLSTEINSEISFLSVSAGGVASFPAASERRSYRARSGRRSRQLCLETLYLIVGRERCCG